MELADKRKYLERWNKTRIAVKYLLFLYVVSHLPFLGAYLVKSSQGVCTDEFVIWLKQLHRLDHIHSAKAMAEEMKKYSDFDITWNCFYSTMRHGEIFIYITSILGTIPIVVNQFNERKRKYPLHLTTMLMLVVGIFISALFYALHQTHQIKIIDGWDADRIVTVVLYILVIIFWFVSLVSSEVLTQESADDTAKEASLSFGDTNHVSGALSDYKG